MKEHQDCRQMALALEGIAGALHSGVAVEPRDLALAASAAEQVWESGPEPGRVRNQEFQTAHAKFVQMADAGAKGGAREAAGVQGAAQSMALQLRATAQEAGDHPARGTLPAAVAKTMSQLATKYGRHGIRAS
ncbi:MAG: hypothetical protein ACYC2H_08370 [Thermoplasmatota archaeon]